MAEEITLDWHNDTESYGYDERPFLYAYSKIGDDGSSFVYRIKPYFAQLNNEIVIRYHVCDSYGELGLEGEPGLLSVEGAKARCIACEEEMIAAAKLEAELEAKE